MEFRIAKAEFLRGLRLAQGIADRKSTMPMLANVLLRARRRAPRAARSPIDRDPVVTAWIAFTVRLLSGSGPA